MKKLIYIAIIAIAVIGLTFIIKPQHVEYQQGIFPVSEEIAGQPIIMQGYLRLPGENEKTAFELTQKYASVEFQKYDFGVFVKSLNGQTPDDKHFWKLYYNGQEAQVGADAIKTKKGDVVEWVIEAISFTNNK